MISAWWCPECGERYELSARERAEPELYINGRYGPSRCGGRLEYGLDGQWHRVHHVLIPAER